MEKRGEKDKQLFFSQLIAEAHPLSDTEGNELIWFDHGLAVLAQESLGPELFGVVPIIGVHMDSIQKRDNVSILGDGVSFELNRSANEKSIVTLVFELTE